MVDIVVTATVNGVPTNGLAQAPQIEIIRTDTQAVVQAFVAMTDGLVSGKYVFPFAPTVTLDYAFTVDADPTSSGQVSSAERYFDGAFPGNIDILADTGDLVNLDVAVSSRNATVPLAAAVDQAEHDATQAAIAAQVVPMDAATSQAEHDATQAAIAALNNISIADVQTALTNQGYTGARALLLDNLDAAISSRNAVTPLAAATDQAEHDNTQVLINAVGALVTGLNDISVGDILTAVLGSGNTVDAELSGILALRDLIEGGRDIDFVGNDVLGWQRIERNVAGTLIRRYNLFDENGARINETVASFIGRSGMISAEVAI